MLKIVCVFLLLGMTALFAAVDGANFTNLTTVVNDADATAKSSVKVFATWFIGLLPLFGLAIGIFGGLKFLKKKNNGQPEENFSKELGYGGMGAFIGLVVAIVFISVMGIGLMGDSTDAFTVLNEFWKTQIFGIS